jgi:hypothetical protein
MDAKVFTRVAPGLAFLAFFGVASTQLVGLCASMD